MRTKPPLKVVLKPKEKLLNRQIIFPFNGLCFISMNSSVPFLYNLRSIDTDTHYSDKPIFCNVEKKLLPFGSYKGRIFTFDFENISELENHITINVTFEPQHFSDKEYSFREYTLDGLYRKFPAKIEASREEAIPLINFRGRHYEIHRIYSALNIPLLCKVGYHSKIIDHFSLTGMYNFKRPWVLHWTDSATLYIKNESNSAIEISSTDVYFAGYLIKPAIESIARINARNSFLIEGISLR